MRILVLLIGLPLVADAQSVAWRCADLAGRPTYQQAPCPDGRRLDLEPVNVMQAYRAARAASATVHDTAPAIGIGPRQRQAAGERLQRL